MDTSINCDQRKSLLFSITKPVVFSFLVQYHRARYSQASSIAPRNHPSMWHFVSPWRLYYIAFTAVFHRVFFPRHSIFSFDRGKRPICWTKPCTNVFFHHFYPLSLSIYERQRLFHVYFMEAIMILSHDTMHFNLCLIIYTFGNPLCANNARLWMWFRICFSNDIRCEFCESARRSACSIACVSIWHRLVGRGTVAVLLKTD